MFTHPEAPQDSQNAQPPQPPQEPTLHTWRVVRDEYDSHTEKVTMRSHYVTAHGITHGNDGEIIFSRFYRDPVLGPQPIPIRSFCDYFEYEEVYPTGAAR